MVDREQNLGAEGTDRGNVLSNPLRPAFHFPDGKILKGIDANSHPAMQSRVTKRRREFHAPPKGA